MKIVGQTDIGLCRKENQDNYRAGRQPDDTVWALVCDGMGGANGGKLASSTASDFLEKKFLKELAGVTKDEQIEAFLADSISRASAKIYRIAGKQPENKGMGTTIVCAVVKDNKAYYAHVGDSRIYLFRKGRLKQITKDHSMVQELIEQGSITEEEAQRHPRKNLITRALGVLPSVKVDTAVCKFEPGDTLLMCSDGLSNFVPSAAIAATLRKTPFFEQAQTLINQAIDGGGQDNITALLVHSETEEEKNLG